MKNSFIALCAFVVLLACNDEKELACVERGVAYFMEIESYPRLSDGRSARKVAEERCARTTTAFP